MENKKPLQKSLVRITNTVTVTSSGVALENFDRQLLLEQFKKLQANSTAKKQCEITAPKSFKIKSK